MRVSTKQATGVTKMRVCERRDRAPASFRATTLPQSRQMLVELCADGHHRVECGHRLLWNKPDRAAE